MTYPTLDTDFNIMCVLSSHDGTHIIDPTNRLVKVYLKDVHDNEFSASWDGVNGMQNNNTFLKDIEYIHPMRKTLAGWNKYNSEIVDNIQTVTRTKEVDGITEEYYQNILIPNKNIVSLDMVDDTEKDKYYQGIYNVNDRGEVSFEDLDDSKDRIITLPYKSKYKALIITVPSNTFKIQGSLFYKVHITYKDSYYQDENKLIGTKWNRMLNVKISK